MRHAHPTSILTRMASRACLLAAALALLAVPSGLAYGQDLPDAIDDPPSAFEVDGAAEAAAEGEAEAAAKAPAANAAAAAPASAPADSSSAAVTPRAPAVVGSGQLPFTGVEQHALVLVLLGGLLAVLGGITMRLARPDDAARS